MAENKLVKIHENLNHLLDSKAKALPKSFNKTRFIQNVMAVLQDTKDIQKAEPVSVARAILKGAFLGLDFLNKEAYVIVRKNKDTQNFDAHFQTDYRGEKKIAKKYSLKAIDYIYAKFVRTGDKFEEYVDSLGEQHLEFRPVPFSDKDIIGAFAVCKYKDGALFTESMTKDEIEKVRHNYSAFPNSIMWTNSWGEAAKKTVTRRLCKNIELEFESIEQAEAYESGSEFKFDEAEYKEVEMPKPVVEKSEKQVRKPKSLDEAMTMEDKGEMPEDEESLGDENKMPKQADLEV